MLILQHVVTTAKQRACAYHTQRHFNSSTLYHVTRCLYLFPILFFCSTYLLNEWTLNNLSSVASKIFYCCDLLLCTSRWIFYTNKCTRILACIFVQTKFEIIKKQQTWSWCFRTKAFDLLHECMTCRIYHALSVSLCFLFLCERLYSSILLLFTTWISSVRCDATLE